VRTADLRLIVVSSLEGVVEPCGCTRTTLGGLDRLATLVQWARGAANPSLTVAAGNLFFDDSSAPPQASAVQPEVWRADTLAAM
jgi:hypothetical protein